MPKRIILHISDLHMSSENILGNLTLIDSLEGDFARVREENSWSGVDLIVVSGDIVQGILQDEPIAKLETQYKEAEEFLKGLASSILDGDLNRIIIVPGNHDVCWAYSTASLKKIESDDGQDSLQYKRNLLKSIGRTRPRQSKK